MAKKSKLIVLIRTVAFIAVVVVVAIMLVAAYDLVVISSVNISGSSMEPTIHGNEDDPDSVMFWQSFYTLDRGAIIVFFNSENVEKYPIENCPVKQHLGILDYLNKCGDVVTDVRNMVVKIFNKNAEQIEHRFRRTREGYRMLIKRVIAVEGDVVKIEDAKLYIKYGGEGEFILQEEPYIYESMRHNGSIAGKYGVNDGEWTVGENELFVLGDNRNVSVDSEDYGPISKEQILGKVFLIRRDNQAIRLN